MEGRLDGLGREIKKVESGRGGVEEELRETKDGVEVLEKGMAGFEAERAE